MYDVFAEPAVEGTYDVTNKKKAIHHDAQTPKQYQQQQRTRNNMFDLKQECRVETTLSHKERYDTIRKSNSWIQNDEYQEMTYGTVQDKTNS